MSDNRCASCNQHETIANLRAAVDAARIALAKWQSNRSNLDEFIHDIRAALGATTTPEEPK